MPGCPNNTKANKKKDGEVFSSRRCWIIIKMKSGKYYYRRKIIEEIVKTTKNKYPQN